MKILNEAEYNKLQQDKKELLKALRKVNEIRDKLLTERKELTKILQLAINYLEVQRPFMNHVEDIQMFDKMKLLLSKNKE